MGAEREETDADTAAKDDALPVFTCVDRWGREVVLTRACWDDHIVAQRPHLAGLEAVVRGVVQSPHYVKHDAVRANAECFYSVGVVPGYPSHVLKVVVKYVQEEGTSALRGYVLSAVSHTSARSKSGESHKWP